MAILRELTCYNKKLSEEYWGQLPSKNDALLFRVCTRDTLSSVLMKCMSRSLFRELFKHLRGKLPFDFTSGYNVLVDVINRKKRTFSVKADCRTIFCEKHVRQIINLVTHSQTNFNPR